MPPKIATDGRDESDRQLKLRIPLDPDDQRQRELVARARKRLRDAGVDVTLDGDEVVVDERIIVWDFDSDAIEMPFSADRGTVLPRLVIDSDPDDDTTGDKQQAIKQAREMLGRAGIFFDTSTSAESGTCVWPLDWSLEGADLIEVPPADPRFAVYRIVSGDPMPDKDVALTIEDGSVVEIDADERKSETRTARKAIEAFVFDWGLFGSLDYATNYRTPYAPQIVSEHNDGILGQVGYDSDFYSGYGYESIYDCLMDDDGDE